MTKSFNFVVAGTKEAEILENMEGIYLNGINRKENIADVEGHKVRIHCECGEQLALNSYMWGIISSFACEKCQKINEVLYLETDELYKTRRKENIHILKQIRNIGTEIINNATTEHILKQISDIEKLLVERTKNRKDLFPHEGYEMPNEKYNHEKYK